MAEAVDVKKFNEGVDYVLELSANLTEKIRTLSASENPMVKMSVGLAGLYQEVGREALLRVREVYSNTGGREQEASKKLLKTTGKIFDALNPFLERVQNLVTTQGDSATSAIAEEYGRCREEIQSNGEGPKLDDRLLGYLTDVLPIDKGRGTQDYREFVEKALNVFVALNPRFDGMFSQSIESSLKKRKTPAYEL